MRIENIRQIAVHANDLDESTAFYRDQLGARFIARFDPPGLVFFNFAGVRLLLEKSAPTAIVYFWVDDIDASCSELERQGISFDEPAHAIFPDAEGLFGPAGEAEWMAFFKDPAGNTLALASRKAIA